MYQSLSPWGDRSAIPNGAPWIKAWNCMFNIEYLELNIANKNNPEQTKKQTTNPPQSPPLLPPHPHSPPQKGYS